jgi:hypothetical protein
MTGSVGETPTDAVETTALLKKSLMIRRRIPVFSWPFPVPNPNLNLNLNPDFNN